MGNRTTAAGNDVMTWIILILYIATVPLANFMISNIGAVCQDHVCFIPVGFDLMAPSGVLVIGIAFVLRDLVQRFSGVPWGLGCVVIGTLISALLSPPALIIASAASFAFSELMDFAVYTYLQKRGFILAVAVSSVLASVIDSAMFLVLAFGSTEFIAGQIVGKWLSICAAIIVLHVFRKTLKGYGL